MSKRHSETDLEPTSTNWDEHKLPPSSRLKISPRWKWFSFGVMAVALVPDLIGIAFFLWPSFEALGWVALGGLLALITTLVAGVSAIWLRRVEPGFSRWATIAAILSLINAIVIWSCILSIGPISMGGR